MIIAIYKKKQGEIRSIEEFKGIESLVYLGQATEIIERMRKYKIALTNIMEDSLVMDEHKRIWINDLTEIRSFKKN